MIAEMQNEKDTFDPNSPQGDGNQADSLLYKLSSKQSFDPNSPQGDGNHRQHNPEDIGTDKLSIPIPRKGTETKEKAKG